MTFHDFIRYGTAMMSIAIAVSIVIAIVELRHLVHRNAGTYNASSKVRLPSPGVYRLYSDGRYGVRRRNRYLLFALATLVLWSYWGSLGILSGVLLLNRFMVSDVWTKLADQPVHALTIIILVAMFTFLLLHLFCAPEAGYLKFLRASIPILAIVTFIAGIGASLVAEGLILRVTYRACRLVTENVVCSTLY